MKKMLFFLRSKQTVYYLFLLLIFTTTRGFSQNDSFSKAQIDRFIIEVFGTKSNELVFNNSSRYKLINNFFKKASIEYRSDIPLNKKFENLFDQPLINKYSKNVRKDDVYTFGMELNILKYDIPMVTKGVLLYRLGESQYFLRLTPNNK